MFSAAPAAAGPADVPQGLSATDWKGIRAAYEANSHSAVSVSGAYQARNPGQRWQTNFDGCGFLTTPDVGDWSWGLELVRYGRVGAELVVEAPSCVEADGVRIRYERDEALTEWYVNDPRGLEHGYTVRRRPECTTGEAPHSDQCPDLFDQSPDRKGGVSARSHGPAHSHSDRSLTVAALNDARERGRNEPLQFILAIRGGLRPRVSHDGRDVTFISPSGAAAVNYNGLMVYDAEGSPVPAWFDVDAQNPQSAIRNPQFLRLVVEDAQAVYPLTIDPIAQLAYLKASNTGGGDNFGLSVAASGDTVVVGAPREDSSATGVDGDGDDNSAADSGAAYVFVRDAGGVWSQQAYLKASNTGALGDRFGHSVAVSGDTVVVGAFQEDSSATGVDGNQADNSAFNSGAAYVFVRDAGGVWSQQAYLKASNTEGGDNFGISVAVSGDTVVVGAHLEDSNATGVDADQDDNSGGSSGAAYVLVRSGGVWSQQAYLKASNTDGGDIFGFSVAVSGDTAVIGAHLEDSNATGVDGNQADNTSADSGAAYVFVRDPGGVWSQQAYLKASNTDTVDRFGDSVAVSGDTVVIGAPREDSSATGVNGDQGNAGPSANYGAAYVFVRDADGVWSQHAYLKASNAGLQDEFGDSAAVSGDTVVVGALGEDRNATGVAGDQDNNSAGSAGAAYVFVRDAADTWSQAAYLKASNTEFDDQFGSSVAVSGDTVVVGAHLEDSNATGVDGNQADNSAFGSGAAYVFTLESCACLGDMNGDGAKDGADIQDFLNCMIAGGSCACADIDGLNGIAIDDVDDFVAELLNTSPCP